MKRLKRFVAKRRREAKYTHCYWCDSKVLKENAINYECHYFCTPEHAQAFVAEIKRQDLDKS